MSRRATLSSLIIILILFTIITPGCTESPPSITITETYSYTTSTEPLTHTTPTRNIPSNVIKVHVINVVDGDTVDIVFPNGTIDRVRFLGVDTPETSASRNKPDEYDHITDLECLASWGKEAKLFTQDYLQDKTIYIEFDAIAGKRGYYGRLLAYIYLENGTDFTALLVKKGYARVYTEGEFKKENEYLTYQNLAKSKYAGLWGCIIGKYASTSGAAIHPSATGKVVIIEVHYDAGGPNVRDTEVLNDEYVVLKNKGETPVDLKGWIIKDNANHIYRFPSIILQPGQEIVLHTGKGVNTSHDLYWGRGQAVWNNDHDTAYLYNAQGELVDQYSW